MSDRANPIRAVLFDFGGTLYDYRTLEAAERESLLTLAGWAGVAQEPAAILGAYRESMRQVFRTYLPQPFYLHRDLFRDAVAGMLAALGATPDAALLQRYRALQWTLHKRDFALRAGVVETLQRLRDRGLRLGIVSNIDDDQLAHLLEIAGLAPRFDFALSSQGCASCKPDPGIFALAVKAAACEPGEAMFVGDTLLQDVAGANRAGMRSVLLWHRDDRDPPAAGVRPHHVIRHIPEVEQLVADPDRRRQS